MSRIVNINAKSQVNCDFGKSVHQNIYTSVMIDL